LAAEPAVATTALSRQTNRANHRLRAKLVREPAQSLFLNQVLFAERVRARVSACAHLRTGANGEDFGRPANFLGART
jgi:hypothetical protein